jgi:hypothetical protein
MEGESRMNTEQQPLFLDFDEFAYGAMVSECRCDGIMTKQCVRLFPDIPVVMDVGICDRCGATWDGRL